MKRRSVLQTILGAMVAPFAALVPGRSATAAFAPARAHSCARQFGLHIPVHSGIHWNGASDLLGECPEGVYFWKIGNECLSPVEFTSQRPGDLMLRVDWDGERVVDATSYRVVADPASGVIEAVDVQPWVFAPRRTFAGDNEWYLTDRGWRVVHHGD